MKIKDIVYGEEEINEPVLIELINSYPLQRLKEVSQFGMPEEYLHKKGFSRFEHSLGVLILLRRLGADLEEQVAGLLHDVSHTAFSHLIDWVIGDYSKEDHQDKTLLKTIKETEVKKILEKYGFDYRKIADIKKYSLLEQEVPNLCADRVDYSLREIAISYKIEDSVNLFNSLQNINEKIVFNSIASSNLFAEYYTKMNREHWTGEIYNACWHVLAEILKKAIKENIISIPDFMKTEREILNKLNKSGNEEILAGLNLLKKGFISKKIENGSGIILKKKSRYIDPEIFHEGKIIPLSEISSDYRNILNKEKQNPVVEQKIEILPIK